MYTKMTRTTSFKTQNYNNIWDRLLNFKTAGDNSH